jgi:hypothetical protein
MPIMIFPIDFVLGRVARLVAGCEGTEERDGGCEVMAASDLEMLPTTQSDQCCMPVEERDQLTFGTPSCLTLSRQHGAFVVRRLACCYFVFAGWNYSKINDGCVGQKILRFKR